MVSLHSSFSLTLDMTKELNLSYKQASKAIYSSGVEKVYILIW